MINVVGEDDEVAVAADISTAVDDEAVDVATDAVATTTGLRRLDQEVAKHP
jgi:hypothetical protein